MQRWSPGKWAKVCVCGAAALQIDYTTQDGHGGGGQTYKEGDFLSINGTAGEVYPGDIKTASLRKSSRCSLRNP